MLTKAELHREASGSLQQPNCSDKPQAETYPPPVRTDSNSHGLWSHKMPNREKRRALLMTRHDCNSEIVCSRNCTCFRLHWHLSEWIFFRSYVDSSKLEMFAGVGLCMHDNVCMCKEHLWGDMQPDTNDLIVVLQWENDLIVVLQWEWACTELHSMPKGKKAQQRNHL